jgi:tetratricopeptide (TPR) repeat protein
VSGHAGIVSVPRGSAPPRSRRIPTGYTETTMSSGGRFVAFAWGVSLERGDTNQHADVYSLMGYSLRKIGDYPASLTFYKKALDFDADHKSAREYLGELYVDMGDLPKAREQLAILTKLCPQGCEEREDLEKLLATKAAKVN